LIASLIYRFIPVSEMADNEFFWDNVRRFAQSNMVTLLILAGVIGTAFLVFIIILICTIKNRKQIYNQYKKANVHSRNVRHEETHVSKQAEANLNIANTTSSVNQATTITCASNNQIMYSSSVQHSAVSMQPYDQNESTMTNPEMALLPNTPARLQANSHLFRKQLDSEISVFENHEGEEEAREGKFEAVEEENQNDVSMVSWFDDAYGTLYRKHKMGSSRQPVDNSSETEIPDVINM